MSNRPGILIIDRDRVVAQVLKQQLEAQGYAIHLASVYDQANQALQRQRNSPDTCRIGVALIDQDTLSRGLDGVRAIHKDWPMVVPIVTSAFRKVESAVTAMRLGAADYLLKPIIQAELIDAVQRAMQRHMIMIERELMQEDVGKPVEQMNQRATDAQEKGWQPMPLSQAMKGPERRILLAALEANGWNRGETAKQLDINRTTLYKKIRQHRLDEPA